MRALVASCFILLLLAACGSPDYLLVQGPAGPKGDVGAIGATGATGSDGAQGATGPTGNSGTDGQDATPVTVVKLCPQTASYPSVFVEYAICLGGQLYAVYSENNGFLALIPPGAYHSEGHGSSCNFTVGAGCVVSY